MTVAVDTTEIILKKIKELPPLPMVVHKLLKIMEDENSCADDVKDVLSSDQALAGKVLKLVNSSFYGLSGEVSTISRAIVILGFATIRNLATGLGVAGIMAKTGKNDQQDFWDHAIATAAAAEILARHIKYGDPEEAFISGLLHDIGHLILQISVPQEFAQVKELGPDKLIENEKKLIGMAHTQAGQKLMEHWKLPAVLGSSVRFHHTAKVFSGKDDPLVSLITLADTFACVHGKVYERSLNQEEFLALVKQTKLDIEEVSEVLAQMDTRIDETKMFLKIAADGELCSSPETVSRELTTVMICTEPTKASWTRQVLQHFGHAMVPMKDFFSGARDHIDLVILDPASVSDDQLQKMKPILADFADRLVVFGQNTDKLEVPALGMTLPCLPLAFSRQDLESAAG